MIRDGGAGGIQVRCGHTFPGDPMDVNIIQKILNMRGGKQLDMRTNAVFRQLRCGIRPALGNS